MPIGIDRELHRDAIRSRGSGASSIGHRVVEVGGVKLGRFGHAIDLDGSRRGKYRGRLAGRGGRCSGGQQRDIGGVGITTILHDETEDVLVATT